MVGATPRDPRAGDPRNIGEVVPGLWRSGRYSARGLGDLAQRVGLRVVVDLRDNPQQLLSARTYERLGVAYHRVPVSEFDGLTDAVYEQVLALAQSGPALVHCYQGRHRTGAWVAAYRVHVCGWSLAEAWAECSCYGFGVYSYRYALYTSVFGGWRAGQGA